MEVRDKNPKHNSKGVPVENQDEKSQYQKVIKSKKSKAKKWLSLKYGFELKK